MRIAVIAMIALVAGQLAFSRVAAAAPLAYLEPIEVYGDTAPDAARAFVLRLLEAAGYQIRVAHPATTPCREPACLAQRAHEVRGAIAVRVAVLGLAGSVSVTMLVVDVATQRSATHTRGAVDLAGADATLADVLRRASSTDRPPHGRSHRMAWVLTGTAIVFLAGGGLAVMEARDRQDTFFAEHVDAMGRVFGISRAAAAAHQATTRRWQVLGGLLVVGAAAAGAAGTYLFLTGDEHAPSGAGIGMTRTF